MSTKLIKCSAKKFFQDLTIDGQTFEKPLVVFADDIFSLTGLGNPEKLNEKAKYLTESNCFYTVLETDYGQERMKGLYDCVIGFGGGATIDKAKFISALPDEKLPCIAIPSMLSTNAFATNYTEITREKEPLYGSKNRCFEKALHKTKVPDYTIIDDDILSISPEWSILGLIEVLAIYTAQIDWILADCCSDDWENNIDLDLYDKASDVCVKAEKYIDENIKTSEAVSEIKNPDFMELATILVECGDLVNTWMNVHENTQPINGAEHLIASALEPYFRGMPHVVAVAVGMMISSFLQIRYMGYKYYLYVCKYLKNLGIFKHIKKYLWKRANILDNVVAMLKPDDKLFTVLNLQPIYGGFAESALITSESVWVTIGNTSYGKYTGFKELEEDEYTK